MEKRHSPSFPWKEVPRRGGGWNRRGMKGNMRKAVSHIVIPSGAEGSLPFAVRDSRFPHMCRALLRFSQLSFMPLEPYPARFARHLPHAGKAYYTGYAFLSFVFMPPRAFAFCHPTVSFSRVQGRFLASLEMTIRGKRYSHFVDFPIGKKVALGRCAFTCQRSSPLKKGRAEGGG